MNSTIVVGSRVVPRVRRLYPSFTEKIDLVIFYILCVKYILKYKYKDIENRLKKKENVGPKEKQKILRKSGVRIR